MQTTAEQISPSELVSLFYKLPLQQQSKIASQIRTETAESRKKSLMEMAKELEGTVVPNDITMEEIVAEVRAYRNGK
ncbi:MAG: hypothetical protein LBO69_04350 [Ignavibacteria bacterium]|nr:hypothetical protein [Ignavibacteria bacterium]